MKHINLTNWKGTITDWTELNYVKGGLADAYAEIANVSGNYLRYSNNLIGAYLDYLDGYAFTEDAGLINTGSQAKVYIFKCNETGTYTYATLNLSSVSSARIGVSDDYVNSATSGGSAAINWSDIQSVENTLDPIVSIDATKGQYIYIQVFSATVAQEGYQLMLVKDDNQYTTYEPYDSLVIEDNENEQIIIVE